MVSLNAALLERVAPPLAKALLIELGRAKRHIEIAVVIRGSPRFAGRPAHKI